MEEEESVKKGPGVKEQLNKGAKKLGAQAAKKVFKKIIAVILPILLKVLIPILIVYVIISSISNFLDINKGDNSKKASSSAINHGSAEKNKISVNTDNIQDGGYELKYEFVDDSGEIISDEESIKKIKSDLLQANRELDLSEFTDSELKIIGSLMYNGLDIEKYNEEQLKALAIFVKADIAGHNFKTGSGSSSKVDIEKLRETDTVDGIIEIQKTTATESGYTQKKLKFVEYATFKEMISAKNKEVLSKFSIDDQDNLVIAKSSVEKITYTYQGADGTELSDADMGKIGEENIAENVDNITITEYPVSINYKQYIEKYIAGYGLLSDLLIATDNVDFCLEIAELTLKSKIVFNICEEQTITKIHSVTKYSQTNLEYDYVDYEVKGYDITEKIVAVASGTGTPSHSSIPSGLQFGHNTTGENGNTQVYSWEKNGESYTLTYNTSNQSWSITKKEKEKKEATTSKESGSQTLIVGGHITESYDGYTIDEDYTSKAEFSYKVIEETSKMDYKYDIDLAEINSWYVSYKKEYESPETKNTVISPPTGVPGQFPQEATVIQEATSDSGIIDSNTYVTAFKKQKENAYLQKYKSNGVDEAKCTIKSLTIKTKSKSDSEVEEYNGTKTTYSFGEENAGDTTQTNLKNVEYVNGIATFTTKGNKGFLYIYDKYLKNGIDLHLKNDSEKKLFELLESNKETEDTSDVIKFLLYVYDGIDRGITDFDKTFKILDISLKNSGGYGPSAFGCNLSKEEFIAAAEAYSVHFVDESLPELFYDICTSEEYNVNPCLAYAWGATESAWGKSAVEDKNLFQIGTYTDQTSGKKFASYEDAIKAFCQWVVDAANPGTDVYKLCYNTSQTYAAEHNKFKGKPENNIYDQFCTFGFVGYTHTPNAKACIRKSAEYIYGSNECNHNDEDATTTKERADWAQYMLETKMDLAKDVFGKNCIISRRGINGPEAIIEAAYQVADHFIQAGTQYASAHKGGNSIILPDEHNIQACYDLPFENPKTYGIVCTTFVNLALWKAGIIDTETMNTFAIHSPIRSAVAMEKLEGWQVITDASELQEGDVVWSENHTWIYMAGDMMLDQTYCVGGPGSNGVLKKADMSKFIKGFRYISSIGNFQEYQQSDMPWGVLTYGGPRGNPNYPGNNGQRKTIGTSGCGMCAVANILSGYTGEAITPDVLLEVLNDEYPAGNYYCPGQGSYGEAVCGILYRYNCTYVNTSSRDEALQAIQAGYAVLGGEHGHFLAFVPVTSEEAKQGYVFRILDSARGHGGLYRSFEEADAVVEGSCVVSQIIYPPE